MIGNFGPAYDSWEAAAANDAAFPHTVRFTYGCGEVMYSTYHTVDFLQRRRDWRRRRWSCSGSSSRSASATRIR